MTESSLAIVSPGREKPHPVTTSYPRGQSSDLQGLGDNGELLTTAPRTPSPPLPCRLSGVQSPVPRPPRSFETLLPPESGSNLGSPEVPGRLPRTPAESRQGLTPRVNEEAHGQCPRSGDTRRRPVLRKTALQPRPSSGTAPLRTVPKVRRRATPWRRHRRRGRVRGCEGSSHWGRPWAPNPAPLTPSCSPSAGAGHWRGRRAEPGFLPATRVSLGEREK